MGQRPFASSACSNIASWRDSHHGSDWSCERAFLDGRTHVRISELHFLREDLEAEGSLRKGACVGLAATSSASDDRSFFFFLSTSSFPQLFFRDRFLPVSIHPAASSACSMLLLLFFLLRRESSLKPKEQLTSESKKKKEPSAGGGNEEGGTGG